MRRMTAYYNAGQYEDALREAVEVRDKALKLYGDKNAVYASCVSNMALMVRCTPFSIQYHIIHTYGCHE